MDRSKNLIFFIAAMVIFGTNGLLVAKISLSSAEIVLMRTFLGFIFLFAVVAARRSFSFSDLKRDIVKVIKSVDSNEYQVLLELRYLCFKTWEQIAVEMGYSIHHLYKVHRQALEAAEKWIPNDTI